MEDPYARYARQVEGFGILVQPSGIRFSDLEMSPKARDATESVSKEYHHLPVSIKAMYSVEEYMWLSDKEKATILQREANPDPEVFV
jgi:hypothetical protein